MEERIARLGGPFEQIERHLTTLDKDLRTSFDRVNSRIDRLEQRIDRLVYWQLGLLGAIAASILATVLTRLL